MEQNKFNGKQRQTNYVNSDDEMQKQILEKNYGIY